MEGPEEPKRSYDLKPPALGRQRRIIAGIVQIANSVGVGSRKPAPARPAARERTRYGGSVEVYLEHSEERQNTDQTETT
jgi:hypothetical protein